MKTIGLVGGLGWASSAIYYDLVNRGVNEALGGHHCARLLLDSHDFQELADRQAAGDWAGIEGMLAASLARLEAAGADFALVACNTIHKVLGGASAAIGIPVLHIADVAGDVLQAAGHRRVALVGTRMTMEDDFYAERLRSGRTLSVVVPDPDERAWLHDVILGELVFGSAKPDTCEAFEQLVARLAARGADALLLACTELSLLARERLDDGATTEGYALPLYDSAALHARAAVEWATAEDVPRPTIELAATSI